MLNEQSQVAYSASSRQEMTQFLPDEYSKVLEIGCNVGNFRKSVAKPCEYWGIEPFEKAAEIAKTKLDKVFIGFYNEVESQIPDNYFDLIIANDVIEHLEQPWEFLQSLKKKMTENASLVLSIPNVCYYRNLKELLCEKDWKYKDIGILDITHLRFFTKKSMIRLLNENGFEIVKIQGIKPLRKKSSISLRYWFFRLLFGNDIKYMQFGIKANPKS